MKSESCIFVAAKTSLASIWNGCMFNYKILYAPIKFEGDLKKVVHGSVTLPEQFCSRLILKQCQRQCHKYQHIHQWRRQPQNRMLLKQLEETYFELLPLGHEFSITFCMWICTHGRRFGWRRQHEGLFLNCKCYSIGYKQTNVDSAFTCLLSIEKMFMCLEIF